MARILYDKELRKSARDLRGGGLSFGEIASRLGIVKSTARLWTADVVLTPTQKRKLYTKGVIAMHSGPNSSSERRRREIDHILSASYKEIKTPIANDALKLLGAALYWAEGDKTRGFAVTNSDPLLIKFMIEWAKKVLRVKASNFVAHLNIYDQQNDNDIKKFWSDLTGIPLENFGKSFIKPISSGYKKNTLYYGTIKIRLKKGTDSVHRVFGWLRVVLKDLNIDVDKVETRWNKLKTDYKRP